MQEMKCINVFGFRSGKDYQLKFYKKEVLGRLINTGNFLFPYVSPITRAAIILETLPNEMSIGTSKIKNSSSTEFKT